MASIIGAAIGAQEAQSDRDAANRARQQALAQFDGISLPDIDSQTMTPELLEFLGNFQAQQEGNINVDPSLMGGIVIDPRLEQAQMAALEQLSQIGETGLMSGEKAALNQARRGSAAEAQAKSSQIMDNMARRGMGGSGAELAAQLQNAQSSADRQSQESDRLMQMAQERALNAIGQSASLAGNVRNQSFSEQSAKAKAQDAINQFNTANQQGVQQRNVASTNAANLRNLGLQQEINNSNVGAKNAAQAQNKALIQQQFNNKMGLAAAKSGQYGNQAGASDAQAGRTANMWAGIGQGIDTGIGTYNNSNKKTTKKSGSDEEDLADVYGWMS